MFTAIQNQMVIVQLTLSAVINYIFVIMLRVKSNFASLNLLNILLSIIFDKVLEISMKIFRHLFVIVKRFFKVVTSLIIVYYLWLPFFIVLFYLLIVFRATLSIIFRVIFKGKYKLMEAGDAVHTFESYANVNTITFFIYINGPCDIEELQSRVEKLFLQYSDQSGQQPYRKLLHLARQKLGFMCWKNMSRTFNVKNHVRYFPGFDQHNQIYRETDLLEALSELSCKEWEYTRPKWEFLVTPQLKRECDNEIYSAITVRISHEYGDGISIMQMFRKHLFDKPVPMLLFDPVNPPIPKISLLVKLFMYFQAFLFGPSCIMKFLSFKKSINIYCKGSLTGPKYFGHNTMEIPLEMVRKVRKHFEISTSAIFHSAFCGAFRTMLERKGQKIPAKITGGMAYGLFPYPNDHLQNHFTPLVDEYMANIEDPIVRAKRIEKGLREMVQPYSLLTTSLAYTFIGLLPACALKAALGVVSVSFVVSNVPGLVGDVKLGGYPVKAIYGSPPSCKGIKYTIGVVCYEGKFHNGFFIDKSTIVQSSQDLDEFIKAFEREIVFFFANVREVDIRNIEPCT